jgi:hypothetical protein
VSIDIQGDVEDILADLRTTEARVRSLDGRTIDVAVDREDLALPDSDEFDLRAALDTSATQPDLAALRSEFLSLPDEETISIDTDADLAGITAVVTALASLPDETTVPIDTEADLGGVLTARSALDGLPEGSATAGIDIDGVADALGGIDAVDQALESLDGEDDQRGVLGGATSVLSGGLRAAPGGRGIARAFAGMSPAAMLGGAGVLGGITAAVAGAVSAGVGAALGAGAIGGGLALPVAMNVDEGEVDALKESVKAALSPLEGGAWEDLQQRLFAGIAQAAGMVASSINSVQDSLLETADEVGDSFWTEFPSILAETTDSVRMLDDDISSIGIGALESIPGIIRESTRAADELLPEFGDIAAPTIDIAGSVSRLGTGALDLGINAFLEPVLNTLAALTPLADLFGDTLHVAGEAAAFVYDNLGSENVDAFAGAIQTAVDLAYAFGNALYAVGDAFGVWETLAAIIRGVGDGLGLIYSTASDAYDALAGGAEWVLGKILDLHNALNDIPGAAEMSSFIAEEDIAMPDLSGAPGGSGSEGSSGPGDYRSGPDPPPAPNATITASALASLPGTDPTSSSGATGPASTTSTASGPGPTPTGPTTTAGGGGTSITNNYNVDIDAGADVTKARVQRWIRITHKRLERQQLKQSTAGSA